MGIATPPRDHIPCGGVVRLFEQVGAIAIGRGENLSETGRLFS
jgi:hypothetical protein